MQQADLVVFGTLVLDHDTLPDAYVAIEGEKVASIGRRANAPAAREVLDLPGTLVLPGMVDAHTHALNAPENGFLNTTSSALAGGVTTVVDMAADVAWPSHDYDPRVTVEALQRKIALGESQSLCDFAAWSAVAPGTVDEIERLAEAGVAGFKMYMCDAKRMGRMDDGALLEAFERIHRLGMVAAVHAESAEIPRHLAAKLRAEGKWDPIYHNVSRPTIAELENVSRALLFSEATGVQLHLLHISAPESVQLARRRDPEHRRVSVETCPHYLMLSEDTVRQVGNLAKIIPPLRTPEQCEMMWDMVKAGWVDSIGTDHSPHDRATKAAPCVFDALNGFPVIQPSLPLMYSEGVVKRGLPLESLVALMSANPARRFGLYPRKGTLLPGSDADLVVFDPSVRWKVAAAELHHGVDFTPWEGWEVTGKPVVTVSRGEVVCRGTEIVAQPGRGRFLRAERRPRPEHRVPKAVESSFSIGWE